MFGLCSKTLHSNTDLKLINDRCLMNPLIEKYNAQIFCAVSHQTRLASHWQQVEELRTARKLTGRPVLGGTGPGHQNQTDCR